MQPLHPSQPLSTASVATRRWPIALASRESAWALSFQLPRSPWGARFTGGRDGKIADIATVAGLIDRGTVNLTIAGTYPFDVQQVRAAYTELMGGHVRGKIVITIP